MYLNPCTLPHGMPRANTKTRTPRWHTDAKIEEMPEYAGELHVGQYDPAAAAAHKKQMEYDVAHGNEEEDTYCDVGDEADSGGDTIEERVNDLEDAMDVVNNHVTELVGETVPDMSDRIQALGEGAERVEARTAELEGHVTANYKMLKVAHSDIDALGKDLHKMTEVEREHREALSRAVSAQINALHEQMRELMARVTVEPKKKSKWLPSFRTHAHMDYANGAFSSPLGASATARARRLHAREYELY